MRLVQDFSELIRQSDPRQVCRLGNITKFFGVLLVITLVARGAAGATVPTVTLQRPSSGSVEQRLQLSGTVSYAGGEPFTVPSGLLVTGVPVQVGQSVKAGDVLATFDPEELERAVASKRAELQQVQTQAAQQEKADRADPYSAQLAQERLERAYEQTHKTYAEGQEEVEKARQKRNEAAQALENVRNAPLDNALTASEAEAQKQANIQAVTQALEAAEEALDQASEAAEDANEAAIAAAQSAEDNRNSALHALKMEEETVADQNKMNQAAAAVSLATAASLQAQLEDLLALQQAGACYTVPKSGTLVQLALKAGENSPAVGGLLADEEADFTLSVLLGKDQTDRITVGTVFHASQSKASGDAAVQHLSEVDDDGNVTATATLPQGAWAAGTASVSATVKSSRQDLVLPVQAVRRDGTGTFVLAAEAQDTMLGLQNVLVRLPVTVLEEGDSTVAVSGPLNSATQVVVTSDKPVQAGDRVRIQNDDV